MATPLLTRLKVLSMLLLLVWIPAAGALDAPMTATVTAPAPPLSSTYEIPERVGDLSLVECPEGSDLHGERLAEVTCSAETESLFASAEFDKAAITKAFEDGMGDCAVASVDEQNRSSYVCTCPAHVEVRCEFVAAESEAMKDFEKRCVAEGARWPIPWFEIPDGSGNRERVLMCHETTYPFGRGIGANAPLASITAVISAEHDVAAEIAKQMAQGMPVNGCRILGEYAASAGGDDISEIMDKLCLNSFDFNPLAGLKYIHVPCCTR